MSGLPTVQIEAAVDLDACTITGTLRTAFRTFVDPVATLPIPADDRTLARVFPGDVDTGRITWTVDGDVVTFRTELPHRYEGLGCARGRLTALGGWYPTPLVDGRLPAARWVVDVTLPDGAAGALGEATGREALHWEGDGERVGLFVARRGEITDVAGAALVTRGTPRKALVRGLERDVPADAPSLVEAPLRRRLARAAPGIAAVSDRAFRVTRPLDRFHRVAVFRSVAEASVANPDPLARGLVGAIEARNFAAELRSATAEGWLDRLSFVPSLNHLLFSGNMPFHADLLERTVPADPVRDDVAERYAPSWPATVVAAQLGALSDDAALTALASSLRLGGDPAAAARAMGLDADLDRFRVPLGAEDWTLRVDGRDVTVTRVGAPDAPEVVVTLRVDGVDATVQETRSATIILPMAPERVILDPRAELPQTSRLGDRLPAPWDWTANAGFDSIDLTDFDVNAGALATLRKAHDTHTLGNLAIQTNEANRLALRLGVVRKEGPLIDGLSRPHRFSLAATVAWLEPGFAPTLGHGWATELGVGWVVDDRTWPDFPLGGSRLGISAAAGVVPGSPDRYANASATGTLVGSPHLRHAVAFRLGAAVAAADFPHRQLSLAGLGQLASLPALPACPTVDDACAVVGLQRATAAAEWRWAALRDVSVPGWLAWGSGLQFSLGPELGAVVGDAGTAMAAGVAAGVTGVADLAGVTPAALGLTVGVPFWVEESLGTDPGTPQFWLRWDQRF